MTLRRPQSPPWASWQKGSVENTNGRLRRQLPRHLDLDTLSQADLQEIVLSLNLTPRKCLDYLTPREAYLKGLGKDVQIKFAREQSPLRLERGVTFSLAA